MNRLPASGARRLAWTLWTPALVLNGLVIGLAVLGSGDALEVVFAVASQAFSTFGAVIASQRPNHRIGWLYLGTGLILGVGNFAIAYAVYAVVVREGALSGGLVAAWTSAWLIPPTFGAVALSFLLFPDGNLPSPRWSPFGWGYAAAITLGTLVVAFVPGDLLGMEGATNPLGLEVGFLEEARLPLLKVVLLSLAAGLLVSALSMAPRFQRAGAVERQQIKWLMYPAVVMALSWVLFGILRTLGATEEAGWFAWSAALAGAGVPVGGGVAILRHRLLDIDLIIRRSIVYGSLWVLIGGAFLAFAGALGMAAGDRLPVQVAIMVTIAATILIQPLRRRVDRLARRAVLGERLTGYELVRRFGETLEHAYDVSELAPRVAAAVRDGLGVRWARLSLRFGAGDDSLLEPAGAAGIGLDEMATPEAAVPLVHAGEDLGVLECGPKPEGRLTDGDHELLGTLARQAALGIRNARLAAELAASLDEIRRHAEEIRASRARIVHAQDTERRRIERYLHDGIQQEIVALKTRLRLARNELRRNPEAADGALIAVQGEIGTIIEDLRELAGGIHPPVLTDRGLVEAIQARASALPIGVTIQASRDVRRARFAEDIEGAAYFFVSEALTNVLKHAQAEAAVVRISAAEGRLVVEVADEGVGFVSATASGSGLAGLKDRIDAVGGGFAVVSRPGEGTKVTADLPARVPVPTDA